MSFKGQWKGPIAVCVKAALVIKVEIIPWRGMHILYVRRDACPHNELCKVVCLIIHLVDYSKFKRPLQKLY